MAGKGSFFIMVIYTTACLFLILPKKESQHPGLNGLFHCSRWVAGRSVGACGGTSCANHEVYHNQSLFNSDSSTNRVSLVPRIGFTQGRVNELGLSNMGIVVRTRMTSYYCSRTLALGGCRQAKLLWTIHLLVKPADHQTLQLYICFVFGTKMFGNFEGIPGFNARLPSA